VEHGLAIRTQRATRRRIDLPGAALHAPWKAAGPATHALLSGTLHAGGSCLVRDAILLAQLYKLPVDDAIDPALFQPVAVLLSHVLAVNEQIRIAAGQASPSPDKAADCSTDAAQCAVPIAEPYDSHQPR
jgi:hypothetical protein